jgi:hypothetical protein
MKMEDFTKRFCSIPTKEIFEQPANDSIYGYIMKETVWYMVYVKNEQDFHADCRQGEDVCWLSFSNRLS